MNREAVLHIINSEYAHAVNDNTLVIRLRAKRGDLQECVLFFGDRACPVEPVVMASAPMSCVATDQLFDYFEVELTTEYPRVCYYFWLSDGVESYFYYGNNFYDSLEAHRSAYYQFPFLRREEIADAPAWVKEAVIYQIFPDSFATARNSLSGAQSITDQAVDGDHGKKGGNLQGIIANLDYLAKLGVTCLYLNPIFTAPTSHKYDTQDYYSVDPDFGDNETLKLLVREAHRLKIKVILDGVFNHCGADFFAFRDVLEKGEKSRYKDWFYQLEFPVAFTDRPNYACFAYVKEMPKLNTGNPEVRDYFLEVATYWIKEADIDGWRLDVADEIDHCFWKEFRKAVKAVKPEAFLLGEIWGDAASWLEGDEFDSTMNYRFAMICREYFAEHKISAAAFDAKVHQLRMRYRKNLSYCQMNLLDSHDVPRFLHWCGGDLRRLKLAVLFQMTFQGIPAIFYGDERGLSGLHEWEYRQPMRWEETTTSRDLYNYYQKLIGLRKQYRRAMLGDYRTVVVDSGQNVYGFSRQHDTEKLLVLINNSEFERKVPLPAEYFGESIVNLMDDQRYQVTGSSFRITLPALSGALIITG